MGLTYTVLVRVKTIEIGANHFANGIFNYGILKFLLDVLALVFVRELTLPTSPKMSHMFKTACFKI